MYAKDPYEAKYQYLINKREKVGLDHFYDPRAFREYSNDMLAVYKNTEDYNPDKKKRKGLISDSNVIRTHNHLVRKRTLNHLAKLAIKLI